MEKTGTLRKAVIIISMAALASIGCSRTPKPEPSPTETVAAETAQPSPTVVRDWEQEISDAGKIKV